MERGMGEEINSAPASQHPTHLGETNYMKLYWVLENRLHDSHSCKMERWIYLYTHGRTHRELLTLWELEMIPMREWGCHQRERLLFLDPFGLHFEF